MSSVPPRPELHFAPPGNFTRNVTQRVRDTFRQSNEHRFGDMGQWWRASMFAGLGIATYGILLTGIGGSFSAASCIALAALSAFMLVVQLGHDAAHGSLSSRPWLNRIVVFTSFAILGVDGALWRDRHIRLHHQVVNLPGTGIDTDSIGIIRLAPDKPWHRWHRLQPFYGPVLYAVGHASLVWLEDPASLRDGRAVGRREFVGGGAIATFLGGKTLHIMLFLLLPWLVLRPAPLSLVLGYAFASGLIAFCFVILVVGTHVSDLAAFPQPDADGGLPHDWATHQLLTSVDWAPTSIIAASLSGGANAHVAHHLFPGHSYRHSAAISRIVAEAAVEHGLPYRATTFGGMVCGHWRHLVALSRCASTSPSKEHLKRSPADPDPVQRA